jgi:hypothetical protein
MSAKRDPGRPDEARQASPSAVVEGRLRLAAHRFTRTPAGVCRIEVELEAPDGTCSQGWAQGAAGATGELRLAAEATLQALQRAVGDAQRFELLGVKSLRAFDASVVIVAVETQRLGQPTRLLGCVQASGELEHAAVLAVLDATNRVCALGAAR